LLGIGEPDLPPEGAARVLATMARTSVLKSMIDGRDFGQKDVNVIL